MSQTPPITSRVLITGVAGFVGYHLAQRLLSAGHYVLGVDNFSDYYDPALKRARVDQLKRCERFEFETLDIADMGRLSKTWELFKPNIAIHLAAQAGVRNSIDNPRDYVNANIVGSFNVFETARTFPVDHLLIASSSSVYGANQSMPFQETDAVATPQSLYAASKASTELIGHSYAHLYGTPMTFFRFFTVYGPWGRPDMAYFKFVKSILEDRPIDVYNYGRNSRDFTYIDDLVQAVELLIDVIPGRGPAVIGDSLSPIAPHRVVNIGQADPVGLMDFISGIERALGRSAELNMLPPQPGDVEVTFASSQLLHSLTGFRPNTPLATGVKQFTEWYHRYVRKDGTYRISDEESVV
ncbi:MAG: NAD-dependent epimerase/dehydratase family protein [Pseudomonadota bacterium]